MSRICVPSSVRLTGSLWSKSLPCSRIVASSSVLLMVFSSRVADILMLLMILTC
jgi:hypothetical protein